MTRIIFFILTAWHLHLLSMIMRVCVCMCVCVYVCVCVCVNCYSEIVKLIVKEPTAPCIMYTVKKIRNFTLKKSVWFSWESSVTELQPTFSGSCLKSVCETVSHMFVTL